MFKELQAQFGDPSCQYRSAPFWSWNDKMEPDEVRRQVRDFHAAGIGGFFMHSRGGLETAFLSQEWFLACDAAVDEARKLGMLAWAYDEDRWPSGTAGGIVTGRYPETAAINLEAVRQSEFPTLMAQVVAVFRPTKKGWVHTQKPANLFDGQQYLVFYSHANKCTLWHNGRPPLDMLSQQAVARFIEVAYQPYANRYPKEFGKTIPGVFTDEPNFFNAGQRQAESGIVMPWTPLMQTAFRKRRCYDLTPYLPALLDEQVVGKTSDQVRHDYWMTLTELFVENFSQQIGQWCSKHKVAWTGHWHSEETLMGQAHVDGSTMPHYMHQEVPGVDILCRRTDELLTVKQTASVAHQWHRKRLISELYGASGWDLSLQDQKWIGDWQYALGVNYRCQHLSHYSLRGARKRDFPPSLMPHQPWWPQYRLLEDYFARLSLALSMGQPVREVAVFHPIRSAWANLSLPYTSHKSAQWPVERHIQKMLDLLLYSQIDLDFVDEMLLAIFGGAVKNSLKMNKVNYKIIVVPEMTHMAPSTAKILLKLAKARAAMFYTGTQTIQVYDAKAPAKTLGDLTRQLNKMLSTVQVDLDALPDLLRAEMAEPVKVAPASRVLYQLRADGDQRLLFLTNQQDGPIQATVEVAGGSELQLWCTETGQPSSWPFEVTDTGVRFNIWMAPAGSLIFTFKAKVPKAAVGGQISGPIQTVPVAMPEGVRYHLDTPNVLLLDKASMAIEGINGVLDGFVPQLGRQTRAIVDLPDNRGFAVQPWAVERHPRPPQPAVLTFTFEVDAVPTSPVLLGVEQPQRKKITVNGEPVSNASKGYYLDPSIPTIPLPALRHGHNTIEIEDNLDVDFEAEPIYLLGTFGVWNGRIGQLPATMPAYDWTKHGLPFYAGRVTHMVPVHVNDAGMYEVEVVTQGIVAVGVGLEGQEKTYRAFGPWRFVLTFESGQNMVAVEMANTLRNLMGPHHHQQERPMLVGPGDLAPDKPVDRYVHVPSGLAELRIARIG